MVKLEKIIGKECNFGVYNPIVCYNQLTIIESFKKDKIFVRDAIFLGTKSSKEIYIDDINIFQFNVKLANNFLGLLDFESHKQILK